MPLKDNPQAYLAELLAEIERLKGKGRRSLYRINDKISDMVANFVKGYFSKTPGYTITLRKCAACKGTWDIIITF